MSDIGEAREQLELIAQMTDKETAQRIRQVIRRYMYRDPYVRKARPQSTPLTPELMGHIMRTARLNPDLSMSKIAEIHNVNIGRVSETLTRKRKL